MHFLEYPCTRELGREYLNERDGTIVEERVGGRGGGNRDREADERVQSIAWGGGGGVVRGGGGGGCGCGSILDLGLGWKRFKMLLIKLLL